MKLRLTSSLPIILMVATAVALSGCNRLTPEQRMERAKTLVQNRDMMGAQLELREIIKKNPEDPTAIDARIGLASLLEAEGSFEDALLNLQEVLAKLPQSDPRGKQALNMSLNMLAKQNRYRDAYALIDEKQKTYANDEGLSLSLNVLRANIQIMEGNTTAARDLVLSYEKVTTDTFVLAEYRKMILRSYFRDSNSTGAIEYLKATVNGTSDNSQRVDLLAQIVGIYTQLEDYSNTRDYLTRVTDEIDTLLKKEIDASRKSMFLLVLADLYNRSGNLDGAITVLERLMATNLDPRDASFAVDRLTQAYLRQARTTDTLTLLKDAARRFPQDPNFGRVATQLESNMMLPEARNLQPETSTLVMSFRNDTTLLVPKNLPTATVTTGTATIATPSTAPTSAATTSTTPQDASTTK